MVAFGAWKLNGGIRPAAKRVAEVRRNERCSAFTIHMGPIGGKGAYTLRIHRVELRCHLTNPWAWPTISGSILDSSKAIESRRQFMMKLHTAFRPSLAEFDIQRRYRADRICAQKTNEWSHPSSELAMQGDAFTAARHLHLLFPSQRSLR